MMAIGAAATLLLSANPAAAQTTDPDALCFIGMTAKLGRVTNNRNQGTDDMSDRLLRGSGFFMGRLSQRYTPAAYATMFKIAYSAFFSMKFDQQSTLIAECERTYNDEFDRVIAAAGG